MFESDVILEERAVSQGTSIENVGLDKIIEQSYGFLIATPSLLCP